MTAHPFFDTGTDAGATYRTYNSAVFYNFTKGLFSLQFDDVRRDRVPWDA